MVAWTSAASRTVPGRTHRAPLHVGEPTDEEREVHDIVRSAQQAGFEAVTPGRRLPGDRPGPRARVISNTRYGEQFIHRTGHGIGLTTHEPPYMVEGEAHELEPGMCFSIEPGIYLSGRFGVRIEDIVTVTEDGGRRLNNTTREMGDRRMTDMVAHGSPGPGCPPTIRLRRSIATHGSGSASHWR